MSNEGWKRAEEMHEETYTRNGSVDAEGFPVPGRRPPAESVMEKRGESARRSREATLQRQRDAIDSLDRVGETLNGGGGILYPDGQGRTPTEEDMRRLEGAGNTDPWWADIAGPLHAPRGDRSGT